MKCPACSAEIGDNAKFCPECGEKIVRKTVCPDCGTEAAPGAKFCAECGHKFAASAPAPTKPETPKKKPVASKKKPAAPKKNPAAPKKAAGPDPAAVKDAVERVFALYHDKDGDCKNATEADARLVKAAAEGGDARAMFLLGEIYDDGCEGFSPDPVASQGWYRRSAEAGDGWGMIAFGMSLAAGDDDAPGVVRDPDEAARWLERGEALVEPVVALFVKMGRVVERATAGLGEGETPDFSEAVPLAESILGEIGEKEPAEMTAVERTSAGNAHFLLGMSAGGKHDFETARNHFEAGAACGNEDCIEMFDRLNRGPDDGSDPGETGAGEPDGKPDGEDGETAGYLVEKNGYLATRKHTEPGLSVDNCRYRFAKKDGHRFFSFVIGVSNRTAFDTGSLRLQFWFADKEYHGGELDGYLVCETDFPDRSLRRGCRYENLELPDIEGKGEPPAGDYHVVAAVAELGEDGAWPLVAWTNFSKPQHWIPAPRVTSSGELIPEAVPFLEEFFADMRGAASPQVLLLGGEVTPEVIRKFAGAAKGKVGGIDAERAFADPGKPFAFVDGTMFHSRKAGLLVTTRGLFAVNGFTSSCPSGWISWSDFIGIDSSLDLDKTEGYDIRLCEYPKVGVTLAIGDFRNELRSLLVDIRKFVRREPITHGK